MVSKTTDQKSDKAKEKSEKREQKIIFTSDI